MPVGLRDFPNCCGMIILTGFTQVRLVDPIDPPPARIQRPARVEDIKLPNRLIRRIVRSGGCRRIVENDRPVTHNMRVMAFNFLEWYHVCEDGSIYRSQKWGQKTLSQERAEVDEYLRNYKPDRGVTAVALNVYQVENIGDIVEAHGFIKVATAGNPIHGSWKAPGGPRTVSLYIRNEQPETTNDVPRNPRGSILPRGV